MTDEQDAAGRPQQSARAEVCIEVEQSNAVLSSASSVISGHGDGECSLPLSADDAKDVLAHGSDPNNPTPPGSGSAGNVDSVHAATEQDSQVFRSASHNSQDGDSLVSRASSHSSGSQDSAPLSYGTGSPSNAAGHTSSFSSQQVGTQSSAGSVKATSGHWEDEKLFRNVEAERRAHNTDTRQLFLSHCWRDPSSQLRKRQLVAQLSLPETEGGPGFRYWADWLDLQAEGPVPWRKEIGVPLAARCLLTENGIANASKVVCMVDEAWLTSFNCLQEIAFAFSYGKPCVVIVLDQKSWEMLVVPGGAEKAWEAANAAHTASAQQAWESETHGVPLLRYEDEDIVPGQPLRLSTVRRLFSRLASINLCPCRDLEVTNSGVDGMLETAVKYVSKDLEYFKAHAELKTLATKWEESAEAGSLLLRGDQTTKWSQWCKSASMADIQPAPTELMRTFVAQSIAQSKRSRQNQMVLVGALLVLSIAGAVAAGVMAAEFARQADIAQNQTKVAEDTLILAQNAEAKAEQEAQAALQSAEESRKAAIGILASAVTSQLSQHQSEQISATEVQLYLRCAMAAKESGNPDIELALMETMRSRFVDGKLVLSHLLNPSVMYGIISDSWNDYYNLLAWSPDGSRLSLLTSDLDFNGTIVWVRDSEGLELVEAGFKPANMAWATDSTWLAIVSAEGEVQVVKATAMEAVAMWTAVTCPSRACRDCQMVWSGALLAVACERTDVSWYAGEAALRVWSFADPDASPRLLYDGFAVGDYPVPSWSPDGELLVISCDVGVHLVDVSTGRRQLLPDQGAPYWERRDRLLTVSAEHGAVKAWYRKLDDSAPAGNDFIEIDRYFFRQYFCLAPEQLDFLANNHPDDAAVKLYLATEKRASVWLNGFLLHEDHPLEIHNMAYWSNIIALTAGQVASMLRAGGNVLAVEVTTISEANPYSGTPGFDSDVRVESSLPFPMGATSECIPADINPKAFVESPFSVSLLGGGDAVGPTGINYQFYAAGSSSLPTLGWTLPVFDDDSWESGPAPIGYISSDSLATELQDTTYQGKYYFRRSFCVSQAQLNFFVESPKPTVKMYLAREGKASAWINGHLVYSDTYSSDMLHWNSVISLVQPTILLVEGGNVLAIEVDAKTSAVGFDADLRLSVPDGSFPEGETTCSPSKVPEPSTAKPAATSSYSLLAGGRPVDGNANSGGLGVAYLYGSGSFPPGWTLPGFDSSAWGVGGLPAGAGDGSWATLLPKEEEGGAYFYMPDLLMYEQDLLVNSFLGLSSQTTWSANGKLLAGPYGSNGASNSLVVWDVYQGSSTISGSNHHDGVDNLMWYDSYRLASNSEPNDKEIQIWNVRLGTVEYVGAFGTPDWSADGSLAVYGSEEVTVFSAISGESRSLPYLLDEYGNAAWSTDGKLVFVCEDGLRVWDPHTSQVHFQEWETLVGFKNADVILVASDGMRVLASLEGENSVAMRVLDVVTGDVVEEVLYIDDRYPDVDECVSSPSGRLFACNVNSGNISVWEGLADSAPWEVLDEETDTSRWQYYFDPPAWGSDNVIAFSRENSTTECEYVRVVYLEPRSVHDLHFPGQDGNSDCLSSYGNVISWSGDASKLAVMAEKILYIFSAADWSVLQVVNRCQAPLTWMGSELLACVPSGTKDIHVWNTSDWGHYGLFGHTATITDVQFSSVGLLASSSADGEVRLWDYHAGRSQLLWSGSNVALNIFDPIDSEVRMLVWAHDGTSLAAFRHGPEVRTWHNLDRDLDSWVQFLENLPMLNVSDLTEPDLVEFGVPMDILNV